VPFPVLFAFICFCLVQRYGQMVNWASGRCGHSQRFFFFCAGWCSGKNTHTRTHSRVINDDANFGTYCGKTRGKTVTHARHW